MLIQWLKSGYLLYIVTRIAKKSRLFVCERKPFLGLRSWNLHGQKIHMKAKCDSFDSSSQTQQVDWKNQVDWLNNVIQSCKQNESRFPRSILHFSNIYSSFHTLQTFNGYKLCSKKWTFLLYVWSVCQNHYLVIRACYWVMQPTYDVHVCDDCC